MKLPSKKRLNQVSLRTEVPSELFLVGPMAWKVSWSSGSRLLLSRRTHLASSGPPPGQGPGGLGSPHGRSVDLPAGPAQCLVG